MIGKKNIVFGFIYLVFTASLGLVMVDKYGAYNEAVSLKQQSVGRLQQLKSEDFEEDLEALSAEQIAKANTDGILAINQLINAEAAIDIIKGGAHAHGNLEALLNVAVGVILCFIIAPPFIKQLISWIFIVGTLLHSGMLYLGRVFFMPWAETVLSTGIGPGLLLLGLLAIGITAALRFQENIIDDRN